MKRLSGLFIVVAFLFSFYLVPPDISSAANKNCKDFKTWKDAQTYFEIKGGSKKNNIDGLDRDHDGLACESNKGFNKNYRNPNDFTCKNFATWKAAQDFFEKRGGSKKKNVNGLDPDHDGLACETNKGFNKNHKNLNNSK
ncbi:Excalibur calcium-binding domain-containing protein [Seinonella peptonophila]|uniref:Excalibur calcium-binding domain-containing protein n=1 Tax=Seinonella peptonophila TaxID=112248 RepID=A0A1M4SLZ8_9BACL|nr:excalibur calcium-binding domain-containing protein [Seinonella peptonophila]SHE33263.1 Excalibur calcium-binding domain-containing protein [Seinonella peptonophila]